MKNVKTNAEFEQIIASDNNLIVVDFYANWCGPCKQIAPSLQKWEEEMDDITFIKIDVDENEETTETCKITAMPTFFFYKNGEKVGEFLGIDKDALKQKIMELKQRL